MGNEVLDLSELSDEELLKLLNDIQEHIAYLNKNIVTITEEDSNEDDE